MKLHYALLMALLSAFLASLITLKISQQPPIVHNCAELKGFPTYYGTKDTDDESVITLKVVGKGHRDYMDRRTLSLTDLNRRGTIVFLDKNIPTGTLLVTKSFYKDGYDQHSVDVVEK